jgi:hypothetical protein
MVMDFEHLTFPTYETASLRSRNITCPFDLDEKDMKASEIFNIYSAANITPILSAAVNLLGILISHYAIVPIGSYLLFSSWLFNGPLVGASSLILPTIALFCIIHITVNAFHRPLSHISGKIGSNSVGSTTASGLYHMRSGYAAEILKDCPILTGSTTLSGSLPKLQSTPWIFSGDMRTILPFLAFKPKKIAYKRRWVSHIHCYETATYFILNAVFMIVTISALEKLRADVRLLCLSLFFNIFLCVLIFL